jgi:hypothetical protein
MWSSTSIFRAIPNQAIELNIRNNAVLADRPKRAKNKNSKIPIVEATDTGDLPGEFLIKLLPAVGLPALTPPAPSSRKAIHLHIEPKAMKSTQKGLCYNARLHHPNGEVIACSTEPLFAACRELVKRGISGHVCKYRNGVLSTEGDIETFAGWAVFENETQGPRICKYRPMPPRGVTATASAAVSGQEAVIPRTLLPAEIGPSRHALPTSALSQTALAMVEE